MGESNTEIILRAYESSGLKPGQFADALRVSPAHISGLLNGNSSPSDSLTELAVMKFLTNSHAVGESSAEYSVDKKTSKGDNLGNPKPLEGTEMDFNWKIEQIIRNAPEEDTDKCLGNIDRLFRKYGNVKTEPSAKKHAG